jgi:hypothetical protein
MAFTTTEKVRALTGLTTTEISDESLAEIIIGATSEVCSKLNSPITRERVWYLDQVRQNIMDGSNKDYYIKNYPKYIADRNKDGDISTTDVIVYLVTNQIETTASISAIYPEQGRFTLTSAPPGSTSFMFVTYDYSSYLQTDAGIDPQVSLAVSYLAASYSMAQKDLGSVSSVKFGNITVNKTASAGFKYYFDRYNQIIESLNSNIGGYAEGTVKI